jgi:predicted helicase
VSTQNKNKWINKLTADYKKGLNERNIQPLSDDYIKFIRYGQHYIENNGDGILAYISNNSFIDGITHRQMRKCLLETFDKIYIFDLHGNSKKKETAPDGSKDENIFDIMQGVSINIFVKSKQKTKNKLAEVYHFDLYGKRNEKFSFLLNNTLKTVKWQQIKYFNHNCFFVPKDFELKEEYEKGFKINELLPVNSSGVKTHNDANLVSFIPFPENNQPFAYRPFDTRYINYDLKKVQRHRYKVMQHFIKRGNVGLLTCRQQSTFDFQHLFVSNSITDICAVSLQTSETTYVFPLYLYVEGGIGNDGVRMPDQKISNLNKTIITEISQRSGLQFIEEKEKVKNTFAPIDILNYIYAVLHSPTYREKYKEFLKIDFPRVPYPENTKQFWKLVELGGKMRRLHLLEDVEPKEGMADYPIAGNNEVEKPQFVNGKVYINDTQYFDKVPLTAWNFYIGGYQPAQKWLKDRKGRTLNYEDIVHYQKMIVALKETKEIMKQIDLKILK